MIEHSLSYDQTALHELIQSALLLLVLWITLTKK